MIPTPKRSSIAIVGGGYTGASIAWSLAALPEAERPEILLYEPRAALGAGLAYDDHEPAHRVNVPAHLMELPNVEPGHFLDWLHASGEAAADPEALAPEGAWFPKRAAFGRYMAEHLAPLLDSGVVAHIREKAAGARPDPQGGWLVRAESGAERHADQLILAATHPPPSPPEALAEALAGHPKFIPDSTVAEALAPIAPQDRVLVVGAGLTGADIVAALDLRGHHGPITMISRRGLRARGRLPTGMEPLSGDFLHPPAASALELIRRVRREIREAEAMGLTWRSVFDSLRAQGQEIWKALPLAERRKLAARLRPFWDAHRFRTAPQVEQVVDRLEAEGRFRLLAASIGEVAAEGAGPIRLTLKLRGGRRENLEVDAVATATGPAHRTSISHQPILADLAAQGFVTLDQVGLGLACDRRGRALGPEGRAHETLFIAGPLARGTFGELMGLPQVTEYARFIAQEAREALQFGRTAAVSPP